MTAPVCSSDLRTHPLPPGRAPRCRAINSRRVLFPAPPSATPRRAPFLDPPAFHADRRGCRTPSVQPGVGWSRDTQDRPLAVRGRRSDISPPLTSKGWIASPWAAHPSGGDRHPQEPALLAVLVFDQVRAFLIWVRWDAWAGLVGPAAWIGHHDPCCMSHPCCTDSPGLPWWPGHSRPSPFISPGKCFHEGIVLALPSALFLVPGM